MADSFSKSIGGFWNGLQQKAAQKIAEREIALVRAKVVGKPVSDDAGNLIIDAGQTVDDAVIARAREAGKMPALVAATVVARTQDIKTQAHDLYAQTSKGAETEALNSVDSYVEARTYIGRTLESEIMDLQGNVVIPAGKQLTAEDVQAAREAGQLQALIYAAQQAPVTSAPVPPANPAERSSYSEALFPLATSRPSPRRAAVPLTDYYEGAPPGEKGS